MVQNIKRRLNIILFFTVILHYNSDLPKKGYKEIINFEDRSVYLRNRMDYFRLKHDRYINKFPAIMAQHKAEKAATASFILKIVVSS